MAATPPPGPPVPAAAANAARAADDPSSILIVDDLPEKLLVFGTVLEELGHDLVFVRSGREALREVLKQEFAVILLDVNMPDLDGFETAAMIRQHKRSALTPIIFITSYADEMQTARGYALGAVDYILSPVVPQVLRSKVQVFVQLFAMQRQIKRQGDARAELMAADAARRAAEQNDRRSEFLSNASRVLGRSVEGAVGAAELAELVVPRLASIAVVLLADANGAPEDVRIAASDARRSQAAPARRIDIAGVAPALMRVLRRAMDSGRAVVLDAQGRAGLDATAFGFEAAEPLPLRCVIAVPLLAGERVLGALLAADQTLACDDPKDASAVGLLELDRALLDDLGGRAASAFENMRLYASLQTEIVERRTAEHELREASRRKDEFLAMLSHELRNPLAPIRTALEVIRRIEPANPKFTWASDIMVRQLRQMTRLIEELLDVARISQGKIALQRERVDLNAVIAQSVETAQPFIDARHQTLTVTRPAEPVWLQGDPARLAQIVSNLLHNAAKYSEQGSAIELAAEPQAGGALLRVRDDGIGIDAALLPRIFDLFTQGGRGLDRSQGGLGVGLTLARRLAEMHGGSLDAASAGTGQGSLFTLRLPSLATDRPVESPAAPSPQAPAQPVRRILVVDDNRDAARSVATFFELVGHEVQTAADGEQALEVAAGFDPEVVVLDIGLPLLDGYQVARRLREAPATRDSLLLALTGYGQAEDRERAVKAGFDHHFVKPADPGALLSCINAWGPARQAGDPLESIHGQAH